MAEAWKRVVRAGRSDSHLNHAAPLICMWELPVHDRPAFLYLLITSMLVGIRRIRIVATLRNLPLFRWFFRTAPHRGLDPSYAEPGELGSSADAFLVCRSLIGANSRAPTPGSNVFFGAQFSDRLANFAAWPGTTTEFAYRVGVPHSYGAILLKERDRAAEILEKRARPRSNRAPTCRSLYDPRAVDLASASHSFARGELEIADVYQTYPRRGEMTVEMLKPGDPGLDTGTPRALSEFGAFARMTEDRKGLDIERSGEVAWRCGFIDSDQLPRFARGKHAHGYAAYLRGPESRRPAVGGPPRHV